MKSLQIQISEQESASARFENVLILQGVLFTE